MIRLLEEENAELVAQNTELEALLRDRETDLEGLEEELERLRPLGASLFNELK